MNPFKIKTLDDFTIADCEAYLNRYPYGEHSIEVKNRMKGLAKSVIKVDKKIRREIVEYLRGCKLGVNVNYIPV